MSGTNLDMLQKDQKTALMLGIWKLINLLLSILHILAISSG